MQQPGEAGLVLHQRANRRLFESEDQVAFPMTRRLSSLDEHGAAPDRNFRRDEVLGTSAGPGSRLTQWMTAAQEPAQLAR